MTRASPVEMTVDPVFDYDPQRKDVSNIHDLSNLSGLFDCERQASTTKKISSAGPQGEIGPPGPKGNTGAIGPKGGPGTGGTKGDTGAIGPKGDSGQLGTRGDTGAIGPKGDSGQLGTLVVAGGIGGAVVLMLAGLVLLGVWLGRRSEGKTTKGEPLSLVGSQSA